MAFLCFLENVETSITHPFHDHIPSLPERNTSYFTLGPSRTRGSYLKFTYKLQLYTVIKRTLCVQLVFRKIISHAWFSSIRFSTPGFQRSKCNMLKKHKEEDFLLKEFFCKTKFYYRSTFCNKRTVFFQYSDYIMAYLSTSQVHKRSWCVQCHLLIGSLLYDNNNDESE